MKRILLLLALTTGFLACKKDKALPPTETEQPAMEHAEVIAAGDLSFSTKPGTGSAKVYRQKNGAYVLGLEQMNLHAATSFVLYLSPTNTISSSSIKIGSVSNLVGNIYHALPDHIDLSVFKYLIILAEPSEETVATAELH